MPEKMIVIDMCAVCGKRLPAKTRPGWTHVRVNAQDPDPKKWRWVPVHDRCVDGPGEGGE